MPEEMWVCNQGPSLTFPVQSQSLCVDAQRQWEGPNANSENGVRRTKLRMASLKKDLSQE